MASGFNIKIILLRISTILRWEKKIIEQRARMTFI